MNQHDLLQLRKDIIQRARAIPRPSPYQIEIERLQGRRLAQYLRLRLDQLHISSHQLAEALEIELDFVTALLDSSFPVSLLSTDMLADMAKALRCEVTDLHKAMQIESE